MTPQELKNSILQLAIQGKLVEQRPEEGTGKELLEKILAAKNAEGAKGREIKLTRSRGVRGGGEEGISNLPKAAKSHHGKLSALSASPREEIPDDEKPFDIPESWEWVRLGEIGTLTRGSGIKRTETCECGFPCVRYGELYTTYKVRFSITKSFVDELLYNNSKKISNGDVVMTLTGENKTDIATAVVYEGQDDIAMGGDMTCWSYHGMESLYLVYLMNSPYAIGCKRKLATGDIIVHISNEKLSSILLPLPPLAEQKRIVAKIEELMPLVDRYEKAWSRLEDFNKRFPADMQKSLLQMAIQGKLVEQRAEEGTGRELLEEIFAAKNAKGSGRKLTRSRGVRGGSEDEGISNLPKTAKSHHGKLSALSASPREEIPDDEKPFDIPESWEFVKVGEVFAHNTGKAMNSSAKFSNKVGAIRKFITTSNLYWDSFDFANVKEMFFSEEELPRCTVKKNDILVCEGGAYYGRTAIWNYDYDMCFQNHIHRLRSYVKVEEKYFYYVFRLYRETGMMKSQGTAMPGLSSKALHELAIPLPPLAEQKRIVAKLEELLPLCERLKAKSGELSQPELSKRSEV